MKYRDLLLTLALLGCVAAANGDEALAEPCFECHGKTGTSDDPFIPLIGGQSAFVLTDWMFIFADEVRPCDARHPEGSGESGSEDHCAKFAGMSEGDMEAIADYYAGQEFAAVCQEFDADKAAVGKQIHDIQCEKCHTEGGSVPEDDSGLLAGQWMPYLSKAMADYRSGAREMPDKMVPKVEPLTNEQVEALVHYYGSLGGN